MYSLYVLAYLAGVVSEGGTVQDCKSGTLFEGEDVSQLAVGLVLEWLL